MLCKVILRTVNDSEKSHEVLLDGGSGCVLHTSQVCLAQANMGKIWVEARHFPEFWQKLSDRGEGEVVF